jgi:4-hydroxybenzoyl-CoA thioesterase
MTEYGEALVGRDPISVRRRVLWGDCDPAGVVYTPRFADYVASARDWFLREGVGVVDRPHPSRQSITYPMRAMAFEFVSFLAADDLFDMTVEVGGLSRRTFTLDIAARHVDRDGLAFSARLTSVCIDQAVGTSVALPEAVREAFERYRARRAAV